MVPDGEADRERWRRLMWENFAAAFRRRTWSGTAHDLLWSAKFALRRCGVRALWMDGAIVRLRGRMQP